MSKEIKSTESYQNLIREGKDNIVEKVSGMNDRSDRSWHDDENKAGGGDACAIKQNGYGSDPVRGKGR